MKIFVSVLLLALSVYTLADKQCWATGDPHYHTFDGFYFDMYGITGDAMLARTRDDSFSVTTRIRYGKYWANRGLQIALVMVMDGNVFEHYGAYWTMNGVRNSWSGLRHAEKVKIEVYGNRYVFHSLVTGIVIDLRANFIENDPNWPTYYFDNYINIPPAYYGKMEGLCGSGNAGAAGDSQNYNWLVSRANPNDPYVRVILPPHDARNHFGLTYVPKRSELAAPIPWKNEEEKKKAYAFCTSLKLNEDHLFNDCLADVQQSGGNLQMGQNYQFTKEDLAELHKDEDEYKKKVAALDLMLKKVGTCDFNKEAQTCKNYGNFVDAEEKKIALLYGRK